MGLRFSDVIDAALRDARTRATSPSSQPATGQDEDGEAAALTAEPSAQAERVPAAAADAVVARAGDALRMDRSS